MWKWLKRLLTLLVVLVLGAVGLAWLKSEPRPVGESGPAADALAQKIQGAVGLEAWKTTKVVSWNHAGRHQILWDRSRGLAKVAVDDWVALLHTSDFTGRAYRAGVEVTDPQEREKILTTGRKWFVNDAYWLFPFEGLFDAGVTRSLVKVPGRPDGLLIQYASGGVTPGDAYLWLPDEQGRPEAWKMWVQILPIGGLHVSWEGWEKLPSGAQISTEHEMVIRFRIQDLRSAERLEELAPGPDPFAPLNG